MCCQGGTAGGVVVAPSSGVIGVTAPMMRLSSALVPESGDVETRRFLEAPPFPWWLAFLVIGGAIVLGGNPK